MCYLYILQSEKDNGFYVGVTNNLKDRFTRHNQGRSKSTKSRGPWKLVFYKIFSNKSEATKEESRVKKMKDKDFIIDYIRSVG